MLWYKAWRESRTRLILGALTLAAVCAGITFFHREPAGGISERSVSYMEYVWRVIYKGYLREVFVLLALLLGVGGLLRERDKQRDLQNPCPRSRGDQTAAAHRKGQSKTGASGRLSLLCWCLCSQNLPENLIPGRRH